MGFIRWMSMAVIVTTAVMAVLVVGSSGYDLSSRGGAEATAQIVAARPDVRVVILTTYESDENILMAIEAGASGYLLKAAPQEEIFAGLRKDRPRAVTKAMELGLLSNSN